MCVCVALVIQHEKRIRCIVLPSVAFPVVQQFSTISSEKMLLNVNVFFLSPQLLPETFLVLGRTERDAINAHMSSCKVPVILVIF